MNNPAPSHSTEEEIVEEFNRYFCQDEVCHACGNIDCDYSTTGCPMRRKGFIVPDMEAKEDNARIKAINIWLRTALSRHRTALLAEVVEIAEGMNVDRSTKVFLEGGGQLPDCSTNESYVKMGYTQALLDIRDQLADLTEAVKNKEV